ncbi:alpha-(1,3)-fucosyltransferase 7 [Electrophorus electricus]|uniref:Fucosyltransferase n=1 Tax=Electrophorus electricus TaxID=8005 RepID=A0AAY5EFJ7_ELEEL|nr:alpha-(1,3)-fucosyltransferase 7 [Electrophorus electricus]
MCSTQMSHPVMKNQLTFIVQLKLWQKKQLLLLSFVLSGIFLKWMLPFQSHENLFYNSSHSAGNITILLWYWPFGVQHNLEGDICLESFGISGCHLVDNRTHYPLAEIVVFHHHELKLQVQTLPLHLPRPASQRWVWLSLEAPENNGNMNQYAGLFDLTMSYNPAADITVPYGKSVPKKRDGEEGPGDFTLSTNKSELACWVVSNYKKWHKRSTVYKQLQQTIAVQVYGEAVNRPLDQGSLLTTISRCYFYLAFENTVSPHYITEKLWRNAFLGGAVPVVLGPPRSDYEAVAPPHSFIHVDDFESTDALGRFLTELARDAERYKSYFAWHQSNSIKLYTDWKERLCTICVVYDKLPYHKYQGLEAWPTD